MTHYFSETVVACPLVPTLLRGNAKGEMNRVKTFVLELPDTAYAALSANGYDEERLAQEAKKYLAVGLFRGTK